MPRATIKKVFLELGGKSAFLVLDDADLARRVRDGGVHRVACTPARAARSPPGWWCRAPSYDEAVEAAAATMAGHQGRRPHRHAHHLRPGDLGAPARPGPVLPRPGDRRGRPIRLRRWTSRRPAEGLLHRADRHRRTGQQRPGGPRGDLRPGADGHRARRRRRRGPHRQRLALRVVGHRVLRRPGARRRQSRPGCGSAPSTSTAVSGTPPDAPFGGYKQSGIGREMGVAGFEEYIEIKVIATLAG